MYGFRSDVQIFVSHVYMGSASSTTVRYEYELIFHHPVITCEVQFTHVAYCPLHIRLWNYIQRSFHQLMGYPSLSRYASHPTTLRLSTAYMLLEHVGPVTGQMLSDTIGEYRKDPIRRQRVFRGIARIMLSLARVPQPRIGSFQFHDNGSISLTNWPLTCTM